MPPVSPATELPTVSVFPAIPTQQSTVAFANVIPDTSQTQTPKTVLLATRPAQLAAEPPTFCVFLAIQRLRSAEVVAPAMLATSQTPRQATVLFAVFPAKLVQTVLPAPPATQPQLSLQALVSALRGCT